MAKQSYSVEEQVNERNLLGNRGVELGFFGRDRDTCSSFSLLFYSQYLAIDKIFCILTGFKYRKLQLTLPGKGRMFNMGDIDCKKVMNYSGEWLEC